MRGSGLGASSSAHLPSPGGVGLPHSALARDEGKAERGSKSSEPLLPSISVPKGGGALSGIDEKLQHDPFSGTASFSIPLPVSPGRGGLQPSLALTYDSGSGNGLFGIGWSVGLPSVSRQTSHGIPRYSDADDTFVLSGAEDLVPALALVSGS